MPLLWEIFLAFAKVAMVGYGGGPAMIPLVQAEVVDVHHWFTNEEFVDTLAMGYALPGPISTKMAGYVGFKIAGLPGAVAGVVGMVMPTLVLMLLLAGILLTYKDTRYVQAVLKAVRPVVVALLVVTVWEILPHSIKGWDTALICVGAFLAVTFLNVHPALAILAAAVLGLIAY
jgi:chromate transporter